MTKNLFLLILWLFSFSLGFAQNTQGSESYKPEKKPSLNKEKDKRFDVHIGLKGGLNRSIILIDPPTEILKYISQTGFNALLFGSLAGAGNPISLQIEAGVLHKRSGWKVNFNDTITQQTFDLQYLTIPMLMKLALGKYVKKDKTHLYLFVGPEFNFLLNGKLHLHKDGETNRITFNESKRIRPMEAGAILGGGVSVPIRRNVFFLLESRGGLGLTNFNRGVIINNFRLRNLYGQVNVGLSFQL